MEQTATKFEEWAIVELFGHTRIAGKVTEATIAGGAFLRVDVPDDKGGILWTRFYGPSAIYSMSPVSEQVARSMAAAIAQPPVQRWELPQITAPTMRRDDDGDDDDNEKAGDRDTGL